MHPYSLLNVATFSFSINLHQQQGKKDPTTSKNKHFGGIVNKLQFGKGASQKKIRDFLGVFPYGGGGSPQSQNFFDLNKKFLVCQNHSEVLKHVLQKREKVISD